MLAALEPVAIKVVCYYVVLAVAALLGIAWAGLLRRESDLTASPRLDPAIDLRSGAAPSASELVRCLSHPEEASEGANVRWIAVYGDSLARGMFFDTVERLNATSPSANEPLLAAGRDSVHPGHSANYSQDCTLMERRPPLRRSKCGGFTFDHVPSAPGRLRPVLLADPNDASPAAAPVSGAAQAEAATSRGGGFGTAAALVRLSFRLKTFTWEPEFDVPWLRALRRSARMPDVLLLSFGIWDMQVELS